MLWHAIGATLAFAATRANGTLLEAAEPEFLQAFARSSPSKSVIRVNSTKVSRPFKLTRGIDQPSQRRLSLGRALALDDSCLFQNEPIEVNLGGEVCHGPIRGDTTTGYQFADGPSREQVFTVTGRLGEDGKDQILIFSTCNANRTFDTLLALLDGCPSPSHLPQPTVVAVNDDNPQNPACCDFVDGVCRPRGSILRFAVPANETYYLLVTGFTDPEDQNAAPEEGEFQLDSICDSVNMPCSTLINPGGSLCGDPVQGSTVGAQDALVGFSSGQHVYSVTGRLSSTGTTQPLTFTTCNTYTNFDTFLSLFRTCPLEDSNAEEGKSAYAFQLHCGCAFLLCLIYT